MSAHAKTYDSAPAVLPSSKAGTGHNFKRLLPFLVLLALAVALPALGNTYWTVIATRAAIYWVLVSGLNLIVGYAGQLAIGYVALLTVGAYTASVLVNGNVSEPWEPYAALTAAGALGGVVGLVVGLPALRLRTFYFAMTTLGFATIVTQIALAWESVTGGGIGVPGPAMPAPFDSDQGLYYLCLGFAALATLLTANIAHSRFGRGLITIRDAEVAAEAFGISKAKLLAAVFVFAGVLAGIAGGLFSSLQTYITPEAFTFELSVLFFISILIGGRSSILGPLLGTVILTILPEVAAPLAAWSNFLYALLLLVIVLAIPGGIASMLDFEGRRPLPGNRRIQPDLNAVREILAEVPRDGQISLDNLHLSFGGVKAIDGLSMRINGGEVHGLIGPNGSGKTTTLNVISGYYQPQQGSITEHGERLPLGRPLDRAARGFARTYQTPRIVGDTSVLKNVMAGGYASAQGSFMEALFRLGRHHADERRLHDLAFAAVRAVGLAQVAHVRADRLQHSELRFLELARALMLQPKYLLLDEPAAGLTGDEIKRLGEIIKEISRCGTAVLLVEHHADLIFDICDHVTVLNLGAVLASGTPQEIRTHKEVVSAYLGA
ncbi:branched-chain amino acid ABC transporter ATP-binding protein/permease [Bordetella sp. 02P26C-1]|uniref:branched-chain amino acid ABC transporter ATP-binding protein/permease n=1 Tax=Bordetella sp. 02P26C-1 TaxID=2683195 RepID=UPI001352A493|nr:branched-chain amino acid ABC transporter ATP-binding protein/permease [Bordetella sp. 02P26C-1]MVW77348.1 ATP-binding cassette domain-containing protein [Bordetella sp. 02P26C-1]